MRRICFLAFIFLFAGPADLLADRYQFDRSFGLRSPSQRIAQDPAHRMRRPHRLPVAPLPPGNPAHPIHPGDKPHHPDHWRPRYLWPVSGTVVRETQTIIIEPAKVLFLNNALNHGVLAPLGVAAVEESGKAIHFLLETNPGPGLGLLVAFYVAGKGMLKESAPGAMIIHFLGGIHEIYFPYVLAHPIMILAMISGGFAADLWFNIFSAGLVATPSPGSIFAYLAVIPKGQHFAVLTGVLVGAIVSFLVGSLILKVRPVKEEEEEAEEVSAGAVPGLS